MNKVIFLLLSGIMLYSCTKIINIDFGKNDPKLVINSVFSTDDILKIRVTKTINYNSTEEEKITTAECKLYCNGEFVETLINKENGNYESTIIPEFGKTYKIEVSCIGFETAIAESHIPNFPTEFRYDTIPSSIFDPDDGLGVLYTNAKLIVTDDQTKENFYYLKLYHKYFTGGEVNPIHRYRSDDPILVGEGIIPYQPMALIFSDIQFNGEHREIMFQHAFSGGVADSTMIVIEKKAITKDYYNYIKSVIIQTNNQGNSNDILNIGEPIQIYSNIQNGYGIFCGINTQIDTIFIYKWNSIPSF